MQEFITENHKASSSLMWQMVLYICSIYLLCNVGNRLCYCLNFTNEMTLPNYWMRFRPNVPFVTKRDQYEDVLSSKWLRYAPVSLQIKTHKRHKNLFITSCIIWLGNETGQFLQKYWPIHYFTNKATNLQVIHANIITYSRSCVISSGRYLPT